MKILPIILAGGSGTRLWPASRTSHPKQLLSLAGERSLLQETAVRLGAHPTAAVYDRSIVSANAEHRFIVRGQLRAAGMEAFTLVLEPVGRNTAPALTLAILAGGADGSVAAESGTGVLSEADDGWDPILLVSPADHVIRDTAAFHAAVLEGASLASIGKVVVFGIAPTRPETGYGYVRVGAGVDMGSESACRGHTARAMVEFIEKPDEPTAAGYIESGDYLWNSGMFMMLRSVWLAAIDRLAPEILAACRAAAQMSRLDGDFVWIDRDAFVKSPAISIDYAVMERLHEVPDIGRPVVVPLDAGWSDLGSWDALWEVSDKDSQGNAARGDVVLEDCCDTLVYADQRLVAVEGCRDMIVVESADAVMVVPRGKTQAVKSLVDRLGHERPEITRVHRRVYRPWGRYESIDAGDRFQVKHIVVEPGAGLSLQLHRHRAEHWVVIRGTAEVTRGNEVFILTENQSIYVPVGELHRLANPGDVPLEIIEVQSGAYLGEDDIVRVEDVYGRTEEPDYLVGR